MDVEWRRGVCVLNCERVQEVLCSEKVPEMCSEKVLKECVRKGTKEGVCLERDKGRDVFPS